MIARAQRLLVNSRNEIKTFVLQTDVNILVNYLYRFVWFYCAMVSQMVAHTFDSMFHMSSKTRGRTTHWMELKWKNYKRKDRQLFRSKSDWGNLEYKHAWKDEKTVDWRKTETKYWIFRCTVSGSSSHKPYDFYIAGWSSRKTNYEWQRVAWGTSSSAPPSTLLWSTRSSWTNFKGRCFVSPACTVIKLGTEPFGVGQFVRKFE